MIATELTDGYKLGHRNQYPEGTEYVYSNWTPRSCEHYPEAKDGVVVFGIQAFIKKYLIDYFNRNFFDRSLHEVLVSWRYRINTFLGPNNNVGEDHIRELHELGYLPIKIKALPEGTLCPIRIPMLTVINTDPRFFWITNFLETLMSNELWLPMTSATTARLYRVELERHANLTGMDREGIEFLCHDFSMRGMAGLDAAIMSGLGHLTSFNGSETIPAIGAAEEYYYAQPSQEVVAATIPATEHSVMCAGGEGEDEFNTFKRLITETYSTGFVSIVSDTWDFWKVMTDYLPRLKDEILTRDGRVVIRPDSGDPVDIICGKIITADRKLDITLEGELDEIDAHELVKAFYKVLDTTFNKDLGWRERTGITNNGRRFKFTNDVSNQRLKIDEIHPTPEYKGAYELLWDIFGGTINDKGYKVLNPKIGIIYGDSITLERQKEIYKRLESKGFCASNLVLGIGSYTYQFKTRDSLGFAMKATWCQINGEGKAIYKQPKTDSGMKNSLKGLIKVDFDTENPIIIAEDQVSQHDEMYGMLKTVFENGSLLEEYTLLEIRNRILDTL